MDIRDAGARPADFDGIVERLRTLRDELGLAPGASTTASGSAAPSGRGPRTVAAASRPERASGRRGFAWDLALLVTAWGGLVSLVVLALQSG